MPIGIRMLMLMMRASISVVRRLALGGRMTPVFILSPQRAPKTWKGETMTDIWWWYLGFGLIIGWIVRRVYEMMTSK